MGKSPLEGNLRHLNTYAQMVSQSNKKVAIQRKFGISCHTVHISI